MLKIFGTAAAIVLGASVMTAGFATAVQAKGFTVLHAFAGAPSDGDTSRGYVTFDQAGNLYGTTYFGGASNNGTIFKIDTHGTETIVHSFDGSTGGGYPAAGLTLDPKTGDLYGVTLAGGNMSACSVGCGALFKLAANGTFSVLRGFTPDTDGAGPGGPLIIDSQGNLYGVAEGGGTFSHGTLFEYSAKGVFTVLHNFDTDAFIPTGRVARDGKGNFYGVTQGGGASTNCFGHGCGTVYGLSSKGKFVILYSFQNGDDGATPLGGLTIDTKGNLFGTTDFNGAGNVGTVFEMSKTGKFTTLFVFNGTNGNQPMDEVLLVNNDLYVTTYAGGANSLGTVNRISRKGVGKVLHTFTGDDGGQAFGGVVANGSVLYGTTGARGADGHGTVFSLKIK